jgi:hypothetical protein
VESKEGGDGKEAIEANEAYLDLGERQGKCPCY